MFQISISSDWIVLQYLIFKTAVCAAGLFYFQKVINAFDFKIKSKFQTVLEW